jgi:hypothetical protein
MNEVIRKNREVCLGKEWITKKVWLSSADRYGLPDFCFKRINEPLTNKVSYTDVLVYLINKYDLKEYLEIGVSVLKTFYQIACNTEANLVAFDINYKNPCIEIPRPYTFFEKKNVLVPEDWDDLKNKNLKHNLIFSDALHDNKGLQAEWDNYIKDHLADNWFIVYDDAWDHPVKYITKHFLPELRKKYGNIYFRKMIVQEWVRGNRHPIFIVSNVPFLIDEKSGG